MKASYDNEPLVLERKPDGYYKYRWNIAQQDEHWSCNEVIVYGTVDSNKVTRAVIDSLWGNGIENKLINDYNEYLITGENSEAKVAYENFLAERKTLKEEIRRVLNEEV